METIATTPVLILDNGAYNIKAGFAGIDFDPRIFPNSIARSKIDKKVYVSDEIDQCKDLSGIAYRRPFDRGMLVHWDAEKIIWDRIFSPAALNVTPSETSLLLTEPYFNLPNIAETYDQIVFEEYEFASYFRSTPAALIPYGGLFGNDLEAPPECAIIIDIGYSYTHVIPLRDGQIIWDHVKRIDIGGKLLTNHLKHLISFRQWNMLDQTCVVNSVREACSYVTMDWKGDVEVCKQNPRSNPIIQEYVLPDFSPHSTSRTGYIRSGPGASTPPPPPPPAPPTNGTTSNGTKRKPKHRSDQNEDEEEQVLYMGNERFAGPELLFHPSDIGLKQSGLPETIAFVISQMPEEVRGMFWAHIGIFGGLGNIPALGERLELDLRALCPTEYELGIFEDFDPQSPPYHSALSLTSSELYLPTFPVTKAEYSEHGSNICRRRFGGPAYNVTPPGMLDGGEGGGDLSDDERERRYAMGMESKYFTGRKGKKGKGKKRGVEEEEEVVTGSWGGRRRRDGV